MSGVFKSIGSIFKGIGNLFGIGSPDIAKGQVPGLKTYDPSKQSNEAIKNNKIAVAMAEQRYAAAEAGMKKQFGGKGENKSNFRKELERSKEALNSARQALAYSTSAKPVPLKRNPGILGGPGAEADLARWDVLSKEWDAEKGKSYRMGGKGEGLHPGHVNKMRIRNELAGLEQKLLGNLWYAPAGYSELIDTNTPKHTTPTPNKPQPPKHTTPMPNKPQPPKHTTPMPAKPAPTPSPSPVAAPAANAAAKIVGKTKLLNTPPRGSGKRPSKRGRMQTLLSGFGGDATEHLGD